MRYLPAQVKRAEPRFEIAARHGGTVSQIVLAWTLRKSSVMLPIFGTSRVAHLEENVAAAHRAVGRRDGDARRRDQERLTAVKIPSESHR